jgi:ribosomal protein S18 acetylase RimI-like enzyme
VSPTAQVFRADESNLSDLAALRYQWRTEELGERGLSPAEFETRFSEWLARHRESHRGYMATIAGVSVGCAWLVIVDRVPGPARFDRRGGMLQSVYVSPEYRNGGVGADLVDLLIGDAREMGLDYLIVHPSERSFPFYRRLGFAAAEKALELRFALA